MRSRENGVPLFAIVFVSFFVFLGGIQLQARTKPAPTSVNGEYVSALATANQFLAAWQTRDREDGLVMLTDAAKEGRSEDQLDNFFSPGDGVAFEIGRGTRLKAGRYAFPVTLLEVTSGHQVRPRVSLVVVIRVGKEEWAVDKLP